MDRRARVLVLIAVAAVVAVILVDRDGPTGPAPSGIEGGTEGQPDPALEAEGAAGAISALTVDVTGQVVDGSNGRPIEDCRIAFKIEGGDRYETRTDVGGRWSLTMPARPDGYVEGVATATGYRQKPLWLMSWSKRWVPPCAGITFLDPVLTTVRGKVVDAGGLPIAGARVTDEDTLLTRTTDARGRFGPFPSGEDGLSLTVLSPDWPRWDKCVEVSDDPPPTMELVLVLPAAQWVTGRVVDDRGRPLGGAVVRDWNYDLERRVETDAQGRFRWPIPRLRAVSVGVDFPGHVMRTYTTDLNGHRENLIVMDRVAGVTGRVESVGGPSPPGGFEVRWDENEIAPVAPDGTFRFESLAPGVGQLEVGESISPHRGKSHVSWLTYGNRPELTLEPGEVRTEVILRVGGGKVLAGRVLDAVTGRPIGNARVEDQFTDEAGRYALVVPAELERDDRVVAVVAEGYFGYQGRPDPVLRMVPTREVTVLVLDPDGRPLPGAFLHRSSAGGEGEAITSPEGRAVCLVSAAGPDEIRLIDRRCEGEMIPVPLDAEHVTFTAKSPARVATIRVMDESGNLLPDARFLHDAVGFHRVADGVLGLRKWDSYVPVSAPGRELVLVREMMADAGGTIHLRLRRSAPLRGRVMDSAGRPIAGIDVDVEAHGYATTDGHGRFVIEGYPVGAQVKVTIWMPGWPDPAAVLTAGGDEGVFRLPRRTTITIRYPAEFATGVPEWRVFRTGDPDRYPYLDSAEEEAECFARRGPGEIDLNLPAVESGIWFRVPPGAPRFYPSVRSRAVLGYDFPKYRPVTGRVTGPDGRPLAGAKITHYASCRSLAWTEEDGRFQFGADEFDLDDEETAAGPAHLLIRHESAVPYLTAPVDLSVGADLRIRLVAGGTLAGRVKGIGPVEDFTLLTGEGFEHSFSRVGSDGTFSCHERIPPGSHRLVVHRKDGTTLTREFVIRAGEETTLAIDGE